MKKSAVCRQLHSVYTRLIAFMLSFAMAITLMPVSAYATDMTLESDRTLLDAVYEFMRNTLSGIDLSDKAVVRVDDKVQVVAEGDATGERLTVTDLVNDISDVEMKSALTALKKEDKKWSTISVSKAVSQLASDRGADWNQQDALRYDGTKMEDNYSLGDFVVDYARQRISAASKVKNSAIRETYNNMADSAGDPGVKIESFESQIRKIAGEEGYNGYPTKSAQEVLNNQGKVSFADYTIGRRIENRTLFIGSYLVHADALNDVIIRLAKDSMGSDNQQIMYYKSELDGGQWKDILGAEGIDDILPSGDIVDDGELDDYVISCVIGSDGIPHNPASGAELNIFELSNPYEMEQIPELNAIYLQRDQFEENSNSTNSEIYNKHLIWRFFNWDTPFDRTRITKSDIDEVLAVQRMRLCFYNLLPKYCGTTRYDGDANAFLSCLFSWQEEAVYYGHGPAWTKPRIYANDYEAHGGHSFFLPLDGPSFYWSQRLPIIRGNLNWTDEKVFSQKYGVNREGRVVDQAKWNVLANSMNDFIEWCAHVYSVHDDITDRADAQLRSLWPVYLSMRRAGESDNADLLSMVMSKVDATRRAEVYYNLTLNEHNNYDLGPSLVYFYNLAKSGKSDVGQCYKYEFRTDEKYTPQSSVVSALEEAIPACQAKYNDLRSNALSEGKTILTRNEYNLCMDVINNAQNNSRVRSTLARLGILENIISGVAEDVAAELSMLNEFLPVADDEFENEVHGIARDKYWTLAGEAEANQQTLKNYLLDQKAVASAKAAQLQELITARAFRLNTVEGTAFINARLDWAEGLRSGIQTGDPFGQYAKEALEAHIKWLKDILSRIKKGSIYETEKEPEDEKEGLVRTYLTALDNQDLEGAAKALDNLEESENDASQENGDGSGDEGGSDANSGENQNANADVPGGGTGGSGNNPPGGNNNGGSTPTGDTGGGGTDDDDEDGGTTDGGGTGGGGGPSGQNTDNNTGGTPDSGDVTPDDTGGTPTPNPSGNTPGGGGTGGGGGTTGGGGETGGRGGQPTGNTDDTNPELDEIADDIASNIIEQLDNDNTDGAINGIHALGDLGAKDKLNDISDAVKARGGDPALTQAISESKEVAKTTPLLGENNSGQTSQAGQNTDTSSGDDSLLDYDTGEDDSDDMDDSGDDSDTGAGEDGSGKSGAGTGGSTEGASGQSASPGSTSSQNQNRNNRRSDRDNDDLSDRARDATARLDNDELDGLDNLIASLFGAEFSQLPDDEKIAVIIACTRYGEDYENTALLNYARNLLNEVISERNPFVYRQYKEDDSTDYVSMAAIDRARRYTRLRYVRNGNRASMTRFGGSSQSYVFNVGKDFVIYTDGKKESLTDEVVQQTDQYIRGSATVKYPYLGVEDSLTLFSISCKYVPDTDWSCLATQSVSNKADMFYDRLDEIFL